MARIRRTIADIVLEKSDILKGAGIFLYQPNPGLSKVLNKFYSTLTQSCFIKALCLLSKYRPEKYNNSIREIF